MDERRRRLGQRPTGGAIRRRRPPPTLRAGQIDPCLSLLLTSSFFRCREARKKERTNERKKERKKERDRANRNAGPKWVKWRRRFVWRRRRR